MRKSRPRNIKNVKKTQNLVSPGARLEPRACLTPKMTFVINTCTCTAPIKLCNYTEWGWLGNKGSLCLLKVYSLTWDMSKTKYNTLSQREH